MGAEGTMRRRLREDFGVHTWWSACVIPLQENWSHGVTNNLSIHEMMSCRFRSCLDFSPHRKPETIESLHVW